MREREKEEKKRSNDSSGYSWHIHIHGGHEETYTKWIMGQWRGLRLRFTSLDCKFLIFRPGFQERGSTTVREGGRRTKGRGCKGPLSARRPLCEATEW